VAVKEGVLELVVNDLVMGEHVHVLVMGALVLVADCLNEHYVLPDALHVHDGGDVLVVDAVVVFL
jgi:hypothetical protein